MRHVQVDGRVLHACKALGMSEGKAMPTAVLAKRLRGLGLAWHSFTLEECQVNVAVTKSGVAANCSTHSRGMIRSEVYTCAYLSRCILRLGALPWRATMRRRTSFVLHSLLLVC